MERIQKKKLDSGSYQKLTDNLVNDISLWDLSADDLTLINITEVGPRRIILNFIERNREASENDIENIHENTQDVSEPRRETVRSILAKETKFQKTLTKLLDVGLVPDAKKLLQMNRILTDHFFGEMMFREKRYPTWPDKQKFAVQIVEEFPHLKQTRVSESAPGESYFFWVYGGMNTGCHTGLIETRVANMRKDISPEDRKFRRVKNKKIFVSEEQISIAAHISALSPTPANIKQIADGMLQAHELHESMLQKNTPTRYQDIIDTFPHFLSYYGERIIQAFDRLQKQPSNGPLLYTLLRVGLLCVKSSWFEVEDDVLRGALRLTKVLSNKGIKRSSSSQNACITALAAEPLIRWISFNHLEPGFDELLPVRQTQSVAEPHIICVAECFKQGNYYVLFKGSVIACGSSSVRAVEVLFISFVVFGTEVPVLLRKLDAMISVNVWGSKTVSKFKTVTDLSYRFKEYLKNPLHN
ncbi:uncharacterized protein LOC135705004 [Ochlerotatus camptorhynchus]|uniref:uncharacterized protein LOC135705004 n=1 Tax=Ochlerotatus camptorhynchus TaxID=644619 RepID=UPI0031E3E819